VTLYDGDGSQQPDLDDRPRSVAQPPTRKELVGSALLTLVICAGVGLVAVILVGAVLVFFDIANTDPTADYQTQTGLPQIVFQAAFAAILVVVWLVGCRAGHGPPGDAILSLVSLDGEGRRADKPAQLGRAAAYVVVFGVLALLERSGLALLAVVALWAPALVRHDRRSLVDLVVGITPSSSAPRRDAQPHPWAR
jgi:hypothetical protein